MSKKNKFYWFEGVTEKGVKDLLNNENSKFHEIFMKKMKIIEFHMRIMKIIEMEKFH